jgi:hypothetical protein
MTVQNFDKFTVDRMCTLVKSSLQNNNNNCEIFAVAVTNRDLARIRSYDRLRSGSVRYLTN